MLLNIDNKFYKEFFFLELMKTPAAKNPSSLRDEEAVKQERLARKKIFLKFSEIPIGINCENIFKNLNQIS